MNAKIKAAIAGIAEGAWTPIKYPRAIWDGQLGCWVSDAEVAETQYTAFDQADGQTVTARLAVRHDARRAPGRPHYVSSSCPDDTALGEGSGELRQGGTWAGERPVQAFQRS
jgi:hypothetical protein